jgi:hypothetical protein
MFNLLTSLRRRVARAFAPHPCERCGAPSCLLYLNTKVRVVEGPGGTLIGIRVSAKTPPPEWLCRACKVAMSG